MKINFATVTGPDDNTDISKLVKLSEEFPFVEWGVLLSKSNKGTEKFPSLGWVDEFLTARAEGKLRASGHIVGRWMRDILDGRWTIVADVQAITTFDRIQFNCHGNLSPLSKPAFSDAMRKVLPMFQKCEFILPWNGKSETQLEHITHVGRFAPVNILYDASGGRGIESQSWPEQCGVLAFHPMGYSGGLRPEKLDFQLAEIFKVGVSGWVDIETGVRDDNNRLDLDKVRAYLEIVSKWRLKQEQS